MTDYRKAVAGDPAGWYLAPSEATDGADALLRGWDGHASTEHVALASDHLSWPPPEWANRPTSALPYGPPTRTEGPTRCVPAS